MRLLSSKEELKDNLIKIIEQSQKELIIISPFIHFRDNNLNKKLKGKENFLEIYTKIDGKTKKEKDDALIVLKKLVDNENKISLIDYLHAKIYINDNTALLSSMNFNDGAYAKSIDFGIITENKKEYDSVIDYCNKNIFIHGKKCILDYFSEHNISDKNIKFEKNRDVIAKCEEGVNFLKLEKDKDTNIRCTVQKAQKSSNAFFIFEVMKNGENCKLENKRYGTYRKGGYSIFLSTDRDDDVSLIPILNKYKEKTLEILVDAYNCLAG